MTASHCHHDGQQNHGISAAPPLESSGQTCEQCQSLSPGLSRGRSPIGSCWLAILLVSFVLEFLPSFSPRFCSVVEGRATRFSEQNCKIRANQAFFFRFCSSGSERGVSLEVFKIRPSQTERTSNDTFVWNEQILEQVSPVSNVSISAQPRRSVRSGGFS